MSLRSLLLIGHKPVSDSFCLNRDQDISTASSSSSLLCQISDLVNGCGTLDVVLCCGKMSPIIADKTTSNKSLETCKTHGLMQDVVLSCISVVQLDSNNETVHRNLPTGDVREPTRTLCPRGCCTMVVEGSARMATTCLVKSQPGKTLPFNYTPCRFRKTKKVLGIIQGPQAGTSLSNFILVHSKVPCNQGVTNESISHPSLIDTGGP